jgi:cytochrome c2
MNFPSSLRLTLVLSLALAACGSARVKFSAPTEVGAPTATPTVQVAPGDIVGTDLDVPLPVGDPAHGDLLFHGKVNGHYPCSACHSLTPGQTLVGPSLGTIATTASTRKPGYSAEKYIHESIVSPNAFTVPGFNQNIMPISFGSQMTKQDLADLVAFLMTKK